MGRDYLLPLPAPGADGPLLAGGWLRFDRMLRLRRGTAPEVVPVDAIEPARLAPFLAARPPVAGVTMRKPTLMGILNVTPDSFSDGGAHLSVEAACAQADRMAAAAILDLGGESTRPGAEEVPADEEARRVLPVLRALRPRTLSIDTRKASVAAAALEEGAALVNDVSALRFDPAMAPLVASTGAAVCLMHSESLPEGADRAGVALDVFDALERAVNRAVGAGIDRARIVVDPGIGFAKTAEENLAILRRLGIFHGLGVPLLLGISRKGFIGKVSGETDPRRRMPGTLAVTLAAVAQGVQIHRVHDVAEVTQGLALWRAVNGMT